MRPRESNGQTVYADYQASTPLDESIAQNIAKYFREQAANPHAHDHAMGWQQHKLIEEARATVAAGIGADPDEIIFTSGATEANNLAVLGLPRQGSRHRLLVSPLEHKSVLAAAAEAKHHGLVTEFLAVDANGRVILDDLHRRLNAEVLAVVVQVVNNEIGTRQPIGEITRLAKPHGCLVISDAAQALTDQPCDVHDLGIDMLSIASHKIYGPQGIGALFIRRDLQAMIMPRAFGGGQQSGLRPGTIPVALCRAFGDAVRLATATNSDTERRHIQTLRDKFARRMLDNKRIKLNGPLLAERHVANCNLQFIGRDAADLLARLQPHLAASTGSACSSGNMEPSYVLRAVGLTDAQARSSIRFSFGRQTTAEDIDRAAALVENALQNLDEIEG